MELPCPVFVKVPPRLAAPRGRGFGWGRPVVEKEITMPSNNQGNQGKQGGASHRGFASMDPTRQPEIAREGGKAAHQKGTAHEFTAEEARQAGSKGGQAAHSGDPQGTGSSGKR
jgi:general stress protein YciG